MKEHLFLYGTLLPSAAPKEIAGIVKRFRRLGTAQVRGKLYDFGDFPGAVLNDNSRTVVHGELVELPPDENVLRALDEYEEFDRLNPRKSLFVRKKTIIRLADGSTCEGWIYVYNKRPGKARLVRGGNYLRSRVA